jgi:Alkylmercury lyase
VVVFVGSDSAAEPPRGDCCPPSADGRCTGAAADRCCAVMNLFTSPANAQDWLASHPTVSGVLLNQERALRLAVDIFGHLLDD